MWPQEKGLECGVTLETVDVCLQLQGLGGGNPGDCGNLTSGGGTVTCCHPRDWGRVTPGSESGRGVTWDPGCSIWVVGSPWRLWICEPTNRVLSMTSTWRLWTCDSSCRVYGVCSPWSRWICDPRFWSGGCSHPGSVTPVSGSGKVSPWKVWTCDPRFRVWGRVSPCRVWICDPRGMVRRRPPWRLWNCESSCRAWEGVTLETVDVWLQVRCLGGITQGAVAMWS